MQGCWLNGVSARKIANITKLFGLESISASEASETNNGIVEMVGEFRLRKLEIECPVVWKYVLYEKIQDNHRIASKSKMES